MRRRPLSAVVHVPSRNRAVWREVRRRHPRVRLRSYGGSFEDALRRRRPGDVILTFGDPPVRRRGRNRDPLDLGDCFGACLRPDLVAVVFTRFVKSECRVRRWDDPRLSVAVGRVAAHEIEHLRRPPGHAHDRRGWFRARYSPAALMRPQL